MCPGIIDRILGRADGMPLTPRRVAALYFLFALSLLVVSDLLLPLWLSGEMLREIQGAKGFVEVLASAAVIYALVAAAQRQLRLKDRAMDEAPVGITIADARREDNAIVYANAGFESITGYEERDCLGRNMRFLQGRNTDPETVERMRTAMDDDRPIEVDVRNYRKDGTSFWNRLNIHPVTDGSGTVTHYLGLQRDVTASKERKQRLSVLNRVLRHNMRNKLNVIRGRTEQLDVAGNDRPSEVASGPERDATRRAIHDATDELIAIADQVQAFDTALDDDCDRYETDVATLLRDLAARVSERHPDATVDVDAPADASVRVHGTFESAVESLLELLADAETPTVSVRVRDDGGAVVVEISDRGGALTPADLRVVARGVETPLEHVLGLELWLVRWATEQSHGEFTVDTESDHLGVVLRLVRTTTDPA